MPQFEFSARPPECVRNFNVLDAPIWNALTNEHREFALGNGLARRYPPFIGPLTALSEQSDAAYSELRELAGSDVTAQFLDKAWEPRRGWSIVRDGTMDQMLWMDAVQFEQELPPTTTLRELTDEDSAAMVALAKLTEPGPFELRTHTLGRFFGIFEAGVLVAMTGQRLHMPGFTEVSAVCTHPDARGRGYSRVLIAQVMSDILMRGETPMLHVFSANTPAIRVYRSLGFTFRRNLHLAVLKAAQD
jgi:GNAT superfamily N-acetyltransferase